MYKTPHTPIGGVSGVSSSCGARGGFLPRHDEDLREPLVRRQGSQVSMRVARGERVLALESREGSRASRSVEEGLSRSFSGGGGKPSFPSPSAWDLRELPRVPLRTEGSWGVGGAPQDSAGSGATEEGLTSRGSRGLRFPLKSRHGSLGAQ